MRIRFGLLLALSALAVSTNCGRDKNPSGPDGVEPGGKPILSGGVGSYTYVVVDSFTGTDGTNIVSHVGNTGQSWSLSGGWTDKIKIQNNAAQLASGADNNNWRMAITTDVADDTFDIWTDYTRGSQNVLGDYAHLEFLAQSGANPPTDRVYVQLSRESATTIMVRLLRTIGFQFAQSVILDSAFPLDTGATKRFGATITGLSVQVWWEPAGGGTRTNIGSPVTLTADYRDGLHRRVAFNFVGAQAFGPGSPRIDNFTVARPLPPDAWTLLVNQMPSFDASKVADLGEGFEVYRTDISLSFKADVSEDAKRAFFTSHSMSSIQVTQAGRFFVRIPDPGTASALVQTIASLRNESQVALAGWVPRSQLPQVLSSRFPIDGPGQERANWVPTSTNTWAMRAIRAPLAWGCETGNYDNTPVRLGIFEWKHQAAHPELALSLTRHSEPPEAQLALHAQPDPPATVTVWETHASETTGLLSAEGDNSSGIAGVSWRSSLYLYAGESSGNRPLPLATATYMLGTEVRADAPRVLSFSVDQGFPSNPNITAADRETMIRSVASDFREVLLNTPGLLVVVAAGNERYRGTVANYLQDTGATLLRGAFLVLREEPLYRDRILIVAGTYAGNNFWDVNPVNPAEGSNFFTGVTDIAAPAQEVTVLAHWTGQTGAAVPTALSNGTSLSAPLVAGVAGLLLGMNPQLTPAQVKDYIVRGAQQPRANEQTGVVGLPQSVSGAPGVYQLDAYGSLTLMAGERQQVPLCGNRVWVQNNQVIAERNPTTHTTETLINLGEPRTFVNARHGGRRIEVSNDVNDRAFEFQLDHWVETQNAATTPYGGTFVSMQAWSHDVDTLVRDRYWTSADTAFFEYTVHTFNPSTQRVLDTLVLRLARFTGGECVRRESDGDCNLVMPSVGTEERVQEKFAYAPIGNRLFVAVTYFVTRWLEFSAWQPCPLPPTGNPDPTTCRNTTYQEVSERTDLWAIDLTTGAETFRWAAPGQVYWLGVSEDGGQIVTGEGVLTTVWTWQPRSDGSGFEQVWSNPGTVTGCGVHYRNLATGAEVRPQILTTDGCTIPTRGNGTIAPVPLLR